VLIWANYGAANLQNSQSQDIEALQMSDSKTHSDSSSTASKPAIGFVTLVCLVVGNMIGVGLYVGGYFSLLSLQDARLVLLVWLVGGLHAICGAIAYGAVANRLPVSGGEYSYLSRCVHPAIGFMAGWISIIAGFTAPIAASGLMIGRYVVQYGYPDSTIPWIATASIVFAGLLHGFHLKLGTSFNNVVIAIKLTCFAIFLIYGIPYVLQGTNSGLLVTGDPSLNRSADLSVRLGEHKTIVQMIVSLFYVSLAYTGFNASIYLAGEVDRKEGNQGQSKKLVSRSMLVACILVTIIYLLLNWVFLYGLSAQSIVDAKEGYVTVVAEQIGGLWLSNLIRLAIILSAATSVLAMMAIGPMVYAQMAEDGRLPKLFGMDKGSPRLAIAVQLVLSCILVWTSEILPIIEYLGLTLTACGALAVSSIWFARAKMALAAPVRWFEHLATAIYVGGAIVFLGVAYQHTFWQFFLCMATFALGGLVYAVSSLFQREDHN
jgi:amino acid transporter